MRNFVSSVVQADNRCQPGKSIENTIWQIRQNRKQRISEKAMKAPVKMLSYGDIYFPAIFIVL